MALDRIRFIGDLHCGSHHGLAHPDRLPASHPSTGSRYLFGCWTRMLENTPERDLLVLMGDLIDGRGRKSDAVGLYTASLGDQVEMAIELLAPLAERAHHIIRVDGTPYHEDFHGALRRLDEALGVSASAQVLPVDLGDDRVLSVAHHPPGGSVMYAGTKLDRTIVWN